MEEQYSQEQVQRLAAEIVNRIVGNDALIQAIAGKRGYTCPDGQLCCDRYYYCDSPFVCQPRFDCMKGFAIYPP